MSHCGWGQGEEAEMAGVRISVLEYWIDNVTFRKDRLIYICRFGFSYGVNCIFPSSKNMSKTTERGVCKSARKK